MTRVLVVDDDAALARALGINLSARGDEVHAAPDGRGALDIDGRQLLLTELHDVTGEHRDAQRLRVLAERDPLTGLPNRSGLLHRLEVSVAEARANGGGVAVCYLDLDGMKTVNDLHGHPAGGQAPARRRRGLARARDHAMRPNTIEATHRPDAFPAAGDPGTLAT